MRVLTAELLALMLLVWLPPGIQAAEIRVAPWKQRDYYAWIVFLSQGPVTWRSVPPKAGGEEAKSMGRAFRIVQLASEIYDTVLVEEIALGHEGCCKKVIRVSRLDLDGFAKAFGFVGEISGFEFVKWESDTSFRFRFKERQFLAAGLDKANITISEAAAPNSAVEQTAGLHSLAAAARRGR